MRITFCQASADRSGGSRVIAQYADRFVRMGHEVAILSAERTRPPLRHRVKRALRRALGRETSPPYRAFLPTFVDDLPHVEHIRVRRQGPMVPSDFPDADVVVATWWRTAEWVRDLPESKGRKAYFIQGLESTIPGVPVERAEATFGFALQPITISRFLQRHVQRVRRRDDVAYVPNAVDLQQFDAAPRGRRTRPTACCIFTGDLPFKGFDLTLRALRRARSRLPELRVTCFGFRPPIGADALPDWFEFHCDPAQDRLASLYASADVFVHGSRVEGFGLPILEAMACRTPVVALPSGAAPELLEGGRGVCVEDLDADLLGDAVTRVLEMDESAWRTMSDLAYRHAHGYSLDDAARRMLRALPTAPA